MLVHQVLGRKTWFVCASAAAESPKLGTCATYGDDEVAPFLDSCSTLTLGPGDSLLLPRRSLHSARAYDDAPSVHVTVGFRSLMEGGCEDVADSTPALVRALPGALASAAAKDLAAAAIPADVDVNVLVESPLFGAAAAVALELEEAPEEWAGYCDGRRGDGLRRVRRGDLPLGRGHEPPLPRLVVRLRQLPRGHVPAVVRRRVLRGLRGGPGRERRGVDVEGRR